MRVNQQIKVSFHFDPKEGQYQRMFKLPHNNTHFTHQQSNAPNSPSQASTLCELRTPRCSNWIQKRQKNRRSNCQHLLDHQKSKRVPEKIYFCFTEYAKALDCVDHNNLWKTLQEIGVPDHLIFLLRNRMQDKKQQLEPDMEQQTGSKLGKEYVKTVYCHPAYFTSMQSSVQFSLVAQSYPTLCNPMDCITPGLPVHH